MRRIVIYSIAGLAAFLALAQLVPYGRDHTNPPIVKEPNWDSSATRGLAVRACYDCHSNETVWSWYSNIAPISWLVQYDVDAGRDEFNFSDWTGGREEGESVSEEIGDGMPQWYYVVMHPSAGLSAEEQQQLADGLRRSGV